MKEIIETVYAVSGAVTFLGILGLPFFSFTIWAIMSWSETIDDLRSYGLKSFFEGYWLNRHDRLVRSIVLGIFPLGTVVFLTIAVTKWIL